MQTLKKTVANLLRDIANKIDANTCEISEEELFDIAKNISHVAISKESSCKYLNLGRSRFDDLVRDGKLPKGRKRVGFKELVWYKDELDDFIAKNR